MIKKIIIVAVVIAVVVIVYKYRTKPNAEQQAANNETKADLSAKSALGTAESMKDMLNESVI